METVKRDPRGQGDRGEASAVMWFIEHGAYVFLPFCHTPRDVDLIVLWHGRMGRVQVKTTTHFHNERWNVTICTRGGNRSWSGVVKRLNSEEYDYLFVMVADGRRWLIPAAVVEATTHVCLGGPKYAEYEIDRDEAISLTPRR